MKRIIFATLICASPVPALAQEPADLIEGRRLFDALEYDQALPFLDRAVSALGDGGLVIGLLSGWPSRASRTTPSATASTRTLDRAGCPPTSR